MAGPVVKREMCEHLISTYHQSVRRVCIVLSFCRSMWYYQSVRDGRPVIDKLTELAELLPTRGFDTYYGRIRQQGYEWSRNKVLRVYRLMELEDGKEVQEKTSKPFQGNIERSFKT